MFKKALVCVDGTESSIKAVNAAKEMLEKNLFEEVVLLSVVNMPPAPEIANAMAFAPENTEHLFVQAKQVLDKAIAVVGDHDRFKTHIETGVPGDAIVHLANRDHYDAILIGNRGYGGLERLFLGSVSTHVVHHAHCPVFVIR